MFSSRFAALHYAGRAVSLWEIVHPQGFFIASFVVALGAIAMALVTDVTGTRLPGNPPLTGVAEPEALH